MTAVASTASHLVATEALVVSEHYTWPLTRPACGCDLCAIQPDGLAIGSGPSRIGTDDTIPVPFDIITILDNNTKQWHSHKGGEGYNIVDLCLPRPAPNHKNHHMGTHLVFLGGLPIRPNGVSWCNRSVTLGSILW